MYNLVSAFIGALIAIMLVFNGVLSNKTGNYTASVIIHCVGLFSMMFLLVLTKSKVKYKRGIPLYIYSAGAIGVFTVLFNNISYLNLGASITLALGLFGQSLAAVTIDHFGLLGMKITKFDKKKILGLLLICLGILIMTIF
jgi:transporter family-2 protein